MTPLPKKKHTRSRSTIRRNAANKLTLATLNVCSNCGKLKEPHKVCRYCGHYEKDAKGKTQPEKNTA